MNKMKTKIFMAAVVFMAAGVITNFSFITDLNGKQLGNSYSYDVSPDLNSKEQLYAAMAKLWESHIVWTRNVILCITDQLPGTEQALNRLLQNQTDIGNAIKSFYGNEAGEKLTELLKAHISIAGEVVTAAKNGNSAALADADNRWHANADEISEFLSSANPNWKLNDMKMMMDNHLKLTTDEAVARIKKDYNSDVAAYDKVHDEILKMSDMLSAGIVKQFPDKFEK